MSERPALLRALTTAARAGVSDTGVEIWRLRYTRHPSVAITLDLATSLGRIRIDLPVRMVGAWCLLDVLHADVARAVRDAVEQREQRGRERDLRDGLLLGERRLTNVKRGASR